MAGDEGPNFTARRFGSREDAVNAPQLIVQFTAVPEPGALTLAGLGLAWLLRKQKRRSGPGTPAG